MSIKTYIATIGTVIDIAMGQDISLATPSTLRFDVLLPDGSLTSWTPTIYGTTHLRYTLLSGDLPQAGIYVITPYIELPVISWAGHTNAIQFIVHQVHSV